MPPVSTISLWLGLTATALSPLLVAGGEPPASADPPQAAENSEKGLAIFGLEPSEITAFLRATPAVVGPVSEVEEAATGWNAMIDYPSQNFAHGADSTTVRFSHRIRIEPSEHPKADLGKLDLKKYAVVLTPVEGEEREVYRLIGTVPIKEFDWDYFETREELWYETGQPLDDVDEAPPPAPHVH
jgi:hypothetical protein